MLEEYSDCKERSEVGVVRWGWSVRIYYYRSLGLKEVETFKKSWQTALACYQ